MKDFLKKLFGKNEEEVTQPEVEVSTEEATSTNEQPEGKTM